MSNLFTLPREVILSNAGALIPGAKAYFYLYGTSTPQDTYTASDLLTANTNPVIADGDGRFPAIYLDSSLRYKVAITDADDVEIYTEDDFQDTLSAADVGAALYPQTAAEIAAGKTPTNYYKRPGDPERFGLNASPGVTDMTTPVQDAIDVADVTGGHVYFDTPGVYLGNWTITSAITIHAVEGVILRGSTAAAVIECTGDFVNVVGGLKIDGDSTSIYCWHHNGANNGKMDSLWLTGATSHGLYIQGIVGDGAYYNQWDNLVSKSNGGDGVKLYGTATPAHRANVNNFYGGQVSSNTGDGFDIDTVAGTGIFGTSIETNTGYALKFTDCTKAAVTMIGGWIESNTAGGVNIDATTLMVQMYGTRFNQATEFSGAGISNSGNVFMVDSINGVLTKWMEIIGGAFRDCHLRTALSDQLQTAGETTLQARVSGDTNWRYQVANNGNIFLGPGSGVSDINYGRGAGGDSILSSKEWAATTGVRVGGVSGPIWTSGSGTPESSVTGSPGDLYSDTGGGASTTLYVKESGSGTNTGWVAK